MTRDTSTRAFRADIERPWTTPLREIDGLHEGGTSSPSRGSASANVCVVVLILGFVGSVFEERLEGVAGDIEELLEQCLLVV